MSFLFERYKGGISLITFDNVNKVFKSDEKKVHAVKDVSFTINKGEIFGVVGFSGAGKSTLIRLVNLLEKPTAGKVFVSDYDIATISQSELRRLRRSEERRVGKERRSRMAAKRCIN